VITSSTNQERVRFSCVMQSFKKPVCGGTTPMWRDGPRFGTIFPCWKDNTVDTTCESVSPSPPTWELFLRDGFLERIA